MHNGFSYEYRLIEGEYTVDNQTHIGYGISLIKRGIIPADIASIHDISTDKSEIVRFIALCNELELDPIHLYDAVDDLLS